MELSQFKNIKLRSLIYKKCQKHLISYHIEIRTIVMKDHVITSVIHGLLIFTTFMNMREQKTLV